MRLPCKQLSVSAAAASQACLGLAVPRVPARLRANRYAGISGKVTYEVLDPLIPRESTTLRHGMTVGLPEPVAHATATVPAWTISGSCERCGMDLTSTTSHTTDGKDRLCVSCFRKPDAD